MSSDLTGAEREIVATMIATHLAPNLSGLVHLTDAFLPVVEDFLEEVHEDERVLLFFDHFGRPLPETRARLQGMAKGRDLTNEAFIIREGIDDMHFKLAIPINTVTREDVVDGLGRPFDQGFEWGDKALFRTADFITNPNALFQVLAILLHFPDREELLEAVIALESRDRAPDWIENVVSPRIDHARLRHDLARWLCEERPDIVLEARKKADDPPARPDLLLRTKPGARIVDEEMILALYNLARDGKKRRFLAALGKSDAEIKIPGAARKAFLDFETKKKAGSDEEIDVWSRILSSHPEAIAAINAFSARLDLSAPGPKVADARNPHKPHPESRRFDIDELLRHDIRSAEYPAVRFSGMRHGQTTGSLPPANETRPIEITVVGGGPSAAFFMLQMARLASASRRPIHLKVLEAGVFYAAFGRFWTHMYADGRHQELGAMRIQSDSPLHWMHLGKAFDKNAQLISFPNHDQGVSFFKVRDLFGTRGQYEKDNTVFERVVKQVITAVSNGFRRLTATVNGKTISWDEIHDFLHEPGAVDRSLNRALEIREAITKLSICEDRSFQVSVDAHIEEGLRDRTIPLAEEHHARLFALPLAELPQEKLLEAKRLIQILSTYALDVGRKTGGWGGYRFMGTASELQTSMINSEVEYFIENLRGLTGLLGPVRNEARRLGGEFFRIDWAYGARVVGLGKGTHDLEDNTLSPSHAAYQVVDPATQAPCERVQLLPCDIITTTVSPSVLARVVAPQMCGSSERVVLDGYDRHGDRLSLVLDSPFRLLRADNAALGQVDPWLAENNWLVKDAADNLPVFNATKMTYEVPREAYETQSFKDAFFPASGQPVVEEQDAVWRLVPVARLADLAHVTAYERPGAPAREKAAALTVGKETCRMVRLAASFVDALPDAHPAKRPAMIGDAPLLPVTRSRLAEFAITEETLRPLYGNADPVCHVEDGIEFVWAPVAAEKARALGRDDPIHRRLNGAILPEQRAVNYVVPAAFAEARLDTDELIPVATRSADPGFFYGCPAHETERFEKAVTRAGFHLANARTPEGEADAKEVYRVADEGTPARALQLIDSARNCYIDTDITDAADRPTATVMDYTWDSNANLAGNAVRSGANADTSLVPIATLAQANNWRAGRDRNPMHVLASSAVAAGSVNYRTSDRYQGGVGMRAPADYARSMSTREFFKYALYAKYAPRDFCPQTVLPMGEAFGDNPGWVSSAHMSVQATVVSLVVTLGGQVDNEMVELLIGAPMLFAAHKASGFIYPHFGASAQIAHHEEQKRLREAFLASRRVAPAGGM
ncbi:hypothetical protein [Breoghania sp. JC706]|uniref:hypothetical protein n=1 Tax=Breoghania sp. JC706 TaxID=3117732 RepID=UPI003009D03C